MFAKKKTEMPEKKQEKKMKMQKKFYKNRSK